MTTGIMFEVVWPDEDPCIDNAAEWRDGVLTDNEIADRLMREMWADGDFSAGEECRIAVWGAPHDGGFEGAVDEMKRRPISDGPVIFKCRAVESIDFIVEVDA